MESGQYDDEFYSRIGEASGRSAAKVLPFVLELVHPRSIVDVGCGSGEWLAAALANHVEDLLGIDGHYARGHLVIPQDLFRAADISEGVTVNRAFDLALCIEVGEHLPGRDAAALVDDLIRLAPVILFGAAIPGQGGVNHVNEQWLDYWVALFEGGGYQLVDCVRRRFWDDPEVVFHAAQNLVLFVREDRLQCDPGLAAKHDPLPLRVVHPELFRMRSQKPLGLGDLLRQVPDAARRTYRARLSSGRRQR